MAEYPRIGAKLNILKKELNLQPEVPERVINYLLLISDKRHL